MKSPCTALAAIALAFAASQPAAAASDNVLPLLPLSLEELIATRKDLAIFVGRVERFSETPAVAPLLFHAGRYGRLAAEQE